MPSTLRRRLQTNDSSKAICSFLGGNKSLEKKYLEGQVAIELTPQGTLAEKLRAGGAGIPAFFVRSFHRDCV